MNQARCKTKRRLNALSISKLMTAMLDAPQSVHDLAEASGLALFTTRSYVLTLHRDGGCYIASWGTDSRGRHTTPEYMIGRRKDTPKPKRSDAERNQAYRERRKQRLAMFALAGKSQVLEAA